MKDNMNYSHESEEPDQGSFSPKKIKKIEEQKKSNGATETSESSQGIRVDCSDPCFSETNTRSAVIVNMDSAAEGVAMINCRADASLTQKNDEIVGINEVFEGQENKEASPTKIKRLNIEDSVPEETATINCDSNFCLTQKNDDIAGINEALEDEESAEASQRNIKRIKMTELSDVPPAYLEVNKVLCSSSPGLPHKFECTLVQPVELESVNPGLCPVTSEKTVISEGSVLIDGNKNNLLEEAPGGYLSCQSTLSNTDDVVLIDESIENKTENYDADFLSPTPTEVGTGIDRLPNAVSTVADNVKFPSISLCDGLDHPSNNDEQCVVSDVDISLKQSDCLGDAVPPDVKENISAEVGRAIASSARKKLLVLDVNGLLVDISSYVPYDYDPDDIIMKKAVFKRPHCDDFLKFCFERFDVGVWTSRTKRNMDPILDFLLGSDRRKLLFSWDQSHCTYTDFFTVEKRRKPLLLKKLKKLWDKFEPDLPWDRGVYNETNTLLLDDTPYKALSNPRYTAVFPNTYRFKDVGDNSIGPGGDLRMYLEGLCMAENVQEYVKQNPFGQRAITEKNLSWGYYLKVIAASSTPPRETEEDDAC